MTGTPKHSTEPRRWEWEIGNSGCTQCVCTDTTLMCAFQCVCPGLHKLYIHTYMHAYYSTYNTARMYCTYIRMCVVLVGSMKILTGRHMYYFMCPWNLQMWPSTNPGSKRPIRVYTDEELSSPDCVLNTPESKRIFPTAVGNFAVRPPYSIIHCSGGNTNYKAPFSLAVMLLWWLSTIELLIERNSFTNCNVSKNSIQR